MIGGENTTTAKQVPEALPPYVPGRGHLDRPAASRVELALIALAVGFVALGATTLRIQGADAGAFAIPLLLGVIAVSLHAWLNRVARERDIVFLPVSILLSGWGLLVIARVAPNFLPRQLLWLVVGAVALGAVTASRDQLRWLRRFKYTWLFLALALLAATLALGVNPGGTGARLWLSIGGLFFQPAEALRLLMVAFLAAFFSERLGETATTWNRLTAHSTSRRAALVNGIRVLAPSIVMWLIAAALLATQQDLGAAALLMIIFGFMLYLASGRVVLPVLGLAALGLAGVVGYLLSSRVAQRIDIWVNPWSDPQGSSFQIVQSLIAVASGGVFGQGLGQGRPDYVPAVHTDFPFAAIGEEFGLIGALALVALFAALVLRAWRVALQSQSAYTLLLAGGLAAALSAQVFVIVGGNLGLVPLTGVTLPFVSYGGSSFVVSFIVVGLLIRLSSDTPAQDDPVYRPTERQRIAGRRAMVVCAALCIAAAVAAGYWGVTRSDALVARDDNPRRIDAERSVARGSLLARDGSPLAYSTPGTPLDDLDLGAHAPYVRQYPAPQAAPVIGYYSWRHGVGGLEAYADATLRGRLSWLDRLLHRRQDGQPFTTTIDLALQQSAFDALTGTTGAAIVMDWRTGEVLALASSPSFDPAALDDQWDMLRSDPSAPLVNRATQGLYQPGALLQWMAVAGLEPITTSVPAWDSIDRFDLGKPVPFELDNAFVPYPATANYSETIGQGSLRVTPLRIAAVAAAFAAGHAVTPTLTAANQPVPSPAQSPISNLQSPIPISNPRSSHSPRSAATGMWAG